MILAFGVVACGGGTMEVTGGPGEARSGEEDLVASGAGPFLVLREGDAPVGGGGLPASYLGGPTGAPGGTLAFTGYLSTGAGLDPFVWVNGAVVWRGSTAGVTGLSDTMGAASGAGYAVQGVDAAGVNLLRSQDGELVRGGAQAPGFEPGWSLALLRHPFLSSDGRVTFWAEVRKPGEPRYYALYRAAGKPGGGLELLLKGGDVVSDGSGGKVALRRDGVDIQGLDVSSDGGHRINALRLQADGLPTAVYVDGAMVARTGLPSSTGESWEGFRWATVNSAGGHLFSGRLAAAQASDEVIASGNEVLLREGDLVDGVRLAGPGAAVIGLQLDDAGRAVHLWAIGFSADHLFHACGKSLASSRRVLSLPRWFDFDGDGVAETYADRFLPDRLGRVGLAEGSVLYARVRLAEGDNFANAVVGVPLPVCPETP